MKEKAKAMNLILVAGAIVLLIGGVIWSCRALSKAADSRVKKIHQHIERGVSGEEAIRRTAPRWER